MLTQSTLQHLLHYDPITGLFTRRVRTCNTVNVGDIAGGVSMGRYLKIHVGGGFYYAHRLAWLYMTGAWPKFHIDHKNGDGLDNRFSNLRDVTRSVNLQNQRLPKSRNKSGFLGVETQPHGFQARISFNGVRKSLGTYKTAEEAHAAYIKAKRELHEGCTI